MPLETAPSSSSYGKNARVSIPKDGSQDNLSKINAMPEQNLGKTKTPKTFATAKMFDTQ